MPAAHCFGWETGRYQQFGGLDFGAAFFGNVVATTDAARSGLYGLEFDVSPGGVGNRTYSIKRQYTGDPAMVFVSRHYFHIPTSLPVSGNDWQLPWLGTNNSNQERTAIYYDVSDGLLKAGRYNNSDVLQESADGPAISADTWVRLDLMLDIPNTTFFWAVDGVEQSTIGTAPSPLFIGFGYEVDTPGVLFYVDDFSVCHTLPLDSGPTRDLVRDRYHIGAGYVRALWPNASGTHNDGGDFSASAGSLADSWQLIDDPAPWLGGATDTVQQDVQDTTTYLEYEFEDLDADEVPFNGMHLFGEIRTTSASANNVEVRALWGATDYLGWDGLWFGGPQIAVIPVGVEMVPPTQAEVNGFLAQWGRSDDVIAVPVLGAFVLEVDIEEVPPVPPIELGVPGAIELQGLVLPVRGNIPRSSPYKIGGRR